MKDVAASTERLVLTDKSILLLAAVELGRYALELQTSNTVRGEWPQPAQMDADTRRAKQDCEHYTFLAERLRKMAGGME